MPQPRSPAAAGRRAFAADPGVFSTRRQTRGLTEGAVLAALAAVAAAAGLIVPPIGILLAPLPIMLLVLRWGMRTAVLAAIVAGLLIFQIFGPMMALSVIIVFAPLGLALGWGVRRELGAQGTVLVGAATFLAASLATLGITTFLLHQDVVGELIRTQVQAWQMAQSFAQRVGAPQSQIDEMRRAVAVLPQFLRTAFPVLAALGALVWAYLCYVLARGVLRRVGHDIPAVPPMLSWRIPPGLATVLLWAGGGFSLASLSVRGLAGIGQPAMLVNLFVFAFQGALVTITWLNARQVPRLAQIIGAMFLFTSGGSLALMLLAVLGMLDTWYDFRRVRPSRPAEPGTPHADTAEGAPGGTPAATPASRPQRQRIKTAHTR